MVLERMAKKLNRQIVGSLAACVHCGMCTDSCHYVLTNPDDPTYAPAYKADRDAQDLQAALRLDGPGLPLVGRRVDACTTDEDLEELKDIAFGKCTNCRRCTINCPMGVDFAMVNRMMRGLLVSVGVMPEGVAVVSKDQWEIGNQMGVLKEDYLETLEWMSEELQQRTGRPDGGDPHRHAGRRRRLLHQSARGEVRSAHHRGRGEDLPSRRREAGPCPARAGT